jgi:hypothetical protein
VVSPGLTLIFFVFAFLMLVWINYTVGVTRTENGGCLARQLSNGNHQADRYSAKIPQRVRAHEGPTA